jgi:hypothetical protein
MSEYIFRTNEITIPGRHGDCNGNSFLFLVVAIDFVIIDYWLWFRLLLLFLEPAEAKEENIRSVSVVDTDSIGLVNNGVRTHERNGIADDTRM